MDPKIQRRLTIELYNLSDGHYDEGATRNFLDFRASQSRDHNSRDHKFNLYKESCENDVRKYSCRVTDQWNNLPDGIVDASSMNAFNNHLDKLWECNGGLYNPDLDFYAMTSAHRTRYETIDVRWNLVLEATTRLFPRKLSCRVVPYRTVPYRTVPCHAAPRRAAPRRIASHRIASHRTAPHRTASHRIASHRIASLQLSIWFPAKSFH